MASVEWIREWPFAALIDQLGAPILAQVLALVFFVTTVVIAFRLYDKKAPRCCYVTDLKIAQKIDAPSDIAIKYKGETVSGISSTLVWLWNAGRKPIKREDLRDDGILKVKLIGGPDSFKILNIDVRKTSRPSIQFRAQQAGPACVDISFNFLDANDGAVIDILHTGCPRTVAVVEGTILEVPKGVANLGALDRASAVIGSQGINLSRRKRSVLRRVTLSGIVVATFCGLIYGLSTLRNQVATTPELLRTHLKTFVKPEDLDRAVLTVTANQPWGEPMPNWLYYLLDLFFLASLTFVLNEVWRRPYAFPEGLRLEDRRAEAKGAEAGAEARRDFVPMA